MCVGGGGTRWGDDGGGGGQRLHTVRGYLSGYTW